MTVHYTGGKGGSGVYQKIISMMPPHKNYFEAFLGNGSIMRHKKPADVSIGCDLDDQVINNLWKGDEVPHLKLIAGDALYFLKQSFYLSENPKETLVYCDPPYLAEVRKTKRQYYRCDMMKGKQHHDLLTVLISLPCNVMISSYENEFYDAMLYDWRKASFTTTNRRGKITTETVYMNFPEPLQLHDYSFLGKDSRERQDIKRLRERWINKLKNMPVQKKFALMAAIEEMKSSSNGKSADPAAQLISAKLPLLDLVI